MAQQAKQEAQMRPIQLGDRVRDKLTKFTGVVIEARVRLYGSRTFIVQPTGPDEDIVPEPREFPPERLIYVNKAVPKDGAATV